MFGTAFTDIFDSGVQGSPAYHLDAEGVMVLFVLFVSASIKCASMLQQELEPGHLLILSVPSRYIYWYLNVISQSFQLYFQIISL